MAKKSLTTTRRHSFNPIVGENPTTLILGITPSEKYIEQGQYYVNPNDCFWEVMSIIFKSPVNLTSAAYNTKLYVIKNNGVALWDIVAECERNGATNKDIVKVNAYNDIPTFLEKYNSIENIVFNGKEAYVYFKRFMQARYPNNSNLKRLVKKNFVIAPCTVARTTENHDKILEDWQKKVAPLFKRDK